MPLLSRASTTVPGSTRQSGGSASSFPRYIYKYELLLLLRVVYIGIHMVWLSLMRGYGDHSPLTTAAALEGEGEVLGVMPLLGEQSGR